MQRVHFQVGVGIFNCQQILISFVIFDIMVKNKSKLECGLAWSVPLSTTILVITVVKICCETISSLDTLTKRETPIFKFCPPVIITLSSRI